MIVAEIFHGVPNDFVLYNGRNGNFFSGLSFSSCDMNKKYHIIKAAKFVRGQFLHTIEGSSTMVVEEIMSQVERKVLFFSPVFEVLALSFIFLEFEQW